MIIGWRGLGRQEVVLVRVRGELKLSTSKDADKQRKVLIDTGREMYATSKKEWFSMTIFFRLLIEKESSCLSACH